MTSAAAPRPSIGGAALLLIGVIIGGVSGGAAATVIASRPSAEIAAPTPSALPAATPISAAPGGPQDVVDVVRQLLPSVVTVVNKLPSGQPQSSGSGIVVDASRGYLVTNNHVVQNVRDTRASANFDVVFSDGRTVKATLVGRDPETDVAVLSVPAGGLVAATLGNSDQVPVGSTVVAIGSALGDFKNSVTEGIVSAKGRRLPSESSPDIFLEDLVQTDAAISPGNSGGPLIWAATKQVIGMNTLVVRESGSEGLGFAISSNTVREIADELIKSGSVVRGFIGITYQPVAGRAALQLGLPAATGGVVIVSVQPASPGAQAGLRANDVVTKVNDQQIDDEHPLKTVMLRFRAGDRVSLTFIRDGKTGTVDVTLGRQ